MKPTIYLLQRENSLLESFELLEMLSSVIFFSYWNYSKMSVKKRRNVEPTAEDLSGVEFESSEEVEVIPTFDAMGLR